MAVCALPVQSTFTLERPTLGRSCQPAPHPLLSQHQAPATPRARHCTALPKDTGPPPGGLSSSRGRLTPAALGRQPERTPPPEPGLRLPQTPPSRGRPHLHRSAGGRHLAAHGEAPERQFRAPPTARNAPWAGPLPVGGAGAVAWPVKPTALS